MDVVTGEQHVANKSAPAVSPTSEWSGVVNMIHTIRILWAFAPLRRAARSAPV